tara:strand:- start:11707 stop:13839 length:2133 start_codon:yes stop_codon:yes gene_type:complete
MKQLIHSYSDGKIIAEELPVPQCDDNGVLIESICSLISSGTEKMLLDFGKSSVFGKIKKQPDRAKEVISKIKNDGIIPTIDAVNNKLNTTNQIGYCSVGRVIEIGKNIKDMSIGDRVISNGPHAEYVSVPRNLCAKIPENVTDDSAVFCVIGSIALQGVRLSNPTLGERYVVFGLGLVGQLCAQILRANGCKVLGIDNCKDKIEIARKSGIDTYHNKNNRDPISKSNEFSMGEGIDAVILSLSSNSPLPIKQAAKMCRKRGRIILIGDTNLELDRADFYEKEISFQVSCSYGPGRYDKDYEIRGNDYPIGFVRWTQNRNFEAILGLMSDNSIQTKYLLSKRFDFSSFNKAYDLLLNDNKNNLGILLDYKKSKTPEKTIVFNPQNKQKTGKSKVRVSVIGTGNYSGRVLLPILNKLGVQLRSLANTGSVRGGYYAKKYNFRKLTTDSDSIFNEKNTNTVLVATRHNTHAKFVIKALSAGMHVFCEKPLAIELEDVLSIQKKFEEFNNTDNFAPIIMVGFNRRFSRFSIRARELIETVDQPIAINMTVNAGYVNQDSWVQDPKIGGGRIIGEACHFIDLARYLVNKKITHFSTSSMKKSIFNEDKAIINLEFEDGSIACIQYFANGHKSFMKERIEIFSDEKIIQINNFKNMKLWGWNNNKTIHFLNQDKGQKKCLSAFVNSIENGRSPPIPFEEILEVSKISIELAEMINN